MILKPQRDPITEALELAGLTPAGPEVQSKNADPTLSEVRNILNKNGASLEDAAKALRASLVDDDNKLQATKLVFQLHGALKDAEKPTVPNIQINIQNNGESKSILSLIAPTA